jgi:hypothetical protein
VRRRPFGTRWGGSLPQEEADTQEAQGRVDTGPCPSLRSTARSPRSGAGAPRRAGEMFQCPDVSLGAFGGILRCPDCGRALVAISAWKGYMRKDGTRKRHFHYACRTRRQRGKEACSYSRTPNALKIEDEVWEAVLLDPERLERGLNAYLKAEVEKDGGILKRKVGYL